MSEILKLATLDNPVLAKLQWTQPTLEVRPQIDVLAIEPCVIVACGEPAAGKSRLIKAIAKRLPPNSVKEFDIDKVRIDLGFNEGLPPDAKSRLTAEAYEYIRLETPGCIAGGQVALVAGNYWCAETREALQAENKRVLVMFARPYPSPEILAQHIARRVQLSPVERAAEGDFSDVYSTKQSLEARSRFQAFRQHEFSITLTQKKPPEILAEEVLMNVVLQQMLD